MQEIFLGLVITFNIVPSDNLHEFGIEYNISNPTQGIVDLDLTYESSRQARTLHWEGQVFPNEKIKSRYYYNLNVWGTNVRDGHFKFHVERVGDTYRLVKVTRITE